MYLPKMKKKQTKKKNPKFRKPPEKIQSWLIGRKKHHIWWEKCKLVVQRFDMDQYIKLNCLYRYVSIRIGIISNRTCHCSLLEHTERIRSNRSSNTLVSSANWFDLYGYFMDTIQFDPIFAYHYRKPGCPVALIFPPT